MQFFLRLRKISVALVPLLLCACTSAVDVPFEPLDDGSRTVEGEHRIRTTSGETYVVDGYTITNSTLIIETLSPADKAHSRVEGPVSLALSDVESIQRLDHGVPLYVMVGGVALFIGAMALVTGGDAFTD